MRKRILTLSFAVLLIFLTFAFVASANCEPTNVDELKAVAAKMNADKRTLVSLDPEHPYIMVTKAQKDFYDQNGYLPADGAKVRLP